MDSNGARFCFLLTFLCLQIIGLDANWLGLRSIYHRQSEHQRLINNADINDNLIMPLEPLSTDNPVPVLVMTERGNKKDAKPVATVGVKTFSNQVLRPTLVRIPVSAYPYLSAQYPSGPLNHRMVQFARATSMPSFNSNKYRGTVTRPAITLSRKAGVIKAQMPLRNGFADHWAHQLQARYNNYKGHSNSLGNGNTKTLGLEKKNQAEERIVDEKKGVHLNNGRSTLGMLSPGGKLERIPLIKIRMPGEKKVDTKETFGEGMRQQGSRKEEVRRKGAVVVEQPRRNSRVLELVKEKPLPLQLILEADQRAQANRIDRYGSSTTRRPSYSTSKGEHDSMAGKSRVNPGGNSVKKDLSKHVTSSVTSQRT